MPEINSFKGQRYSAQNHGSISALDSIKIHQFGKRNNFEPIQSSWKTRKEHLQTKTNSMTSFATYNTTNAADRVIKLF